MEQKLCKKCSSELPEDHKGARCDDCKAERMRRIKKIGLTICAGVVVIVGAVFATAKPKNDEDSEDSESFGSDSSKAAEMGISLSDYLKLSEAIEDGKISLGWANSNVDAIRDGLLTAGEVIYFGTGTDDDD